MTPVVALVVERERGVRADAELGLVAEVHLHDHRLDEHLPARAVELLDEPLDRGEVGAARLDEQRVLRLVGGDLHLAAEELGGLAARRRGRAPARRRAPGWPGSAAGTPAAPGAPALRLPLREVRERLRQLLGVRVLEEHDVDAALAARRDVELLDELEDALEALLVRDDDELVRPLVRDDLRDGDLPPRRPAAGAGAAAAGWPGRAGAGARAASASPPGRPCAWKIWLSLSAMSFAAA